MSRRTLMPNAENCSSAELETALKCAHSPRSRDRLMAMRALLQGIAYEQVHRLFDVSSRTLHTWVLRFNARGIDGLIERPRPGRLRKIAAEHTARLRRVVQQPQEAGQSHWTAVKFHGYLRTELETELSYSTVLRWLHEQDFRLKVPQPWPDRQDEDERRRWVLELGRLLQDESVELWYADEMGVEGDPRPRRRWAARGTKARITKNGDHIRMNVCGAVCPRTGQFYALEFSHSNRATFQAFLDHASADIEFGRSRNILIVDNASWHKSKSLNWGAFEPLYQPPYSPDLNPIEKLWMVIKAEWFSDFIAKSTEQLIERLDAALLWAMDRTENNKQTCNNRKNL